jgi:hypothetical protein
VSLVSVLVSAILPVVAVAGVGYVLGRYKEIALSPLSTITIYVLAPALIFYSVLTTPISTGVAGRLAAGVTIFTLLIAVVAVGFGKALGEEQGTLDAFVLSSTFSNSGNYGIPLSAFAFGAIGRSTAVLYIVVQGILVYTLGVYLAARNGAGTARTAVKKVVSLPQIYAVLAALLVRRAGATPPLDSSIMETIKLTGDSAIPVMLLMLGIQLADSTAGSTIGRVAPATALKLVGAPILAIGVALAVGLDGTVGKVFVLECAMPVAVTPLLLTTEFGSNEGPVTAADYVSTAILASTIASLATLTALIVLLQNGMLL